jgi:hypothetical protein
MKDLGNAMKIKIDSISNEMMVIISDNKEQGENKTNYMIVADLGRDVSFS